MTQFTEETQEKVNEKFASFKNGNFSNEDTEKVFNNIDDILKKSSSGPLAKFFGYIKTMCELVKTWVKKEYREVPVRTIGLVILTLGYVLAPVDIIPDFIPGLGFIDDATMVSLCLASVRSDLDDFMEWKKGQKQTI